MLSMPAQEQRSSEDLHKEGCVHCPVFAMVAWQGQGTLPPSVKAVLNEFNKYKVWVERLSENCSYWVTAVAESAFGYSTLPAHPAHSRAFLGFESQTSPTVPQRSKS